MVQLRGPFRSRSFWELYLAAQLRGWRTAQAPSSCSSSLVLFAVAETRDLSHHFVFKGHLTTKAQTTCNVWKLIGNGNDFLKSSRIPSWWLQCQDSLLFLFVLGLLCLASLWWALAVCEEPKNCAGSGQKGSVIGVCILNRERPILAGMVRKQGPSIHLCKVMRFMYDSGWR